MLKLATSFAQGKANGRMRGYIAQMVIDISEKKQISTKRIFYATLVKKVTNVLSTNTNHQNRINH